MQEAHAHARAGDDHERRDPDLSGNPVARAHARAARDSRPEPEGAEHPLGRALVFLVVVPAIVFLVSNPIGWLTLFGLCLGIAVLTGFGGIL
jgi:hypothetical protein